MHQLSETSSSVELGTRFNAGHAADRKLPRHWTDIHFGQSLEERTLAIAKNIGTDRALRARGLDPKTVRSGLQPATGIPTMTAHQALARVAALGRR